MHSRLLRTSKQPLICFQETSIRSFQQGDLHLVVAATEGAAQVASAGIARERVAPAGPPAWLEVVHVGLGLLALAARLPLAGSGPAACTAAVVMHTVPAPPCSDVASDISPPSLRPGLARHDRSQLHVAIALPAQALQSKAGGLDGVQDGNERAVAGNIAAARADPAMLSWVVRRCTAWERWRGRGCSWSSQSVSSSWVEYVLRCTRRARSRRVVAAVMPTAAAARLAAAPPVPRFSHDHHAHAGW